MYSVCPCSLPVWRRSFLKKGTPRDLFWPRPGSTPERIWPKNNNTCKGPWVLHAHKFHQNTSSGSGEEVENVKVNDARRTTDDARRMDGRTDDGRCAMTIAHLTLLLRWAKNRKEICHNSRKSHVTSELLQQHFKALCYQVHLYYAQ